MIDEKIAILFKNWDEALIWSCLQGFMGKINVDNESNPTSAIITVGDFCFCAGIPEDSLLRTITDFKLIIPKNKSWEILIENHFREKVNKVLRYAIKKEKDIFDKAKLNSYIKSLDVNYDLKLFDEKIFQMAKKENWSADLCSQFKSFSDYQNYAIGAAILHNGSLIAGASPYGIYNNGIEIEIDTKPKYRNQGLATICGAKLILECLKRNIYPSWDAHDLRSVHLAEKLGYHLSHSYVTYELLI